MRNRMFVHGWCVLPVVVLLAGVGQALAAPPAPEKLFPAATTEFVAISDANKMAATWEQTQFRQLLLDPAMRPFLNDVAGNTKGFNYLLDTIGVDFDVVKNAT